MCFFLPNFFFPLMSALFHLVAHEIFHRRILFYCCKDKRRSDEKFEGIAKRGESAFFGKFKIERNF